LRFNEGRPIAVPESQEAFLALGNARGLGIVPVPVPGPCEMANLLELECSRASGGLRRPSPASKDGGQSRPV